MALAPGVDDGRVAVADSPSQPDLSDAEQRILAALSNRPLGLYPAASVAVAAGVEYKAVQSALERLVEFGLVTGTEEPVRSRPARREVVWRLDVIEAWSRVPDALRWTPLPELSPPSMPECLPDRFRHLFWWGEPELYRLPRDAVFVAEQILTSEDVTSWHWALSALPGEALERVADKPHVPEDRKSIIRGALAKRRAERVIAALSAAGEFNYDQPATGRSIRETFNTVNVDIVAHEDEYVLGPSLDVDGLQVGSLQDITAGKLRAIAGRRQLRDYVDVMLVEALGGISLVQAIVLYHRRHGLDLHVHGSEGFLRHLMDFEHLDDDPAMAAAFGDDIRCRVIEYFQSRQAEVVAKLEQVLIDE